MRLFSKRHKTDTVEQRSNSGNSSPNIGASLTYGGTSYTNSKALTISAVYRAVECISDALASLPLIPNRVDPTGFKTKDYKHPLYKIINVRPNSRMNRNTLIKLLVCDMLLKGNGYAYIERDNKKKPVAIHYLPNEFVTILYPTYINQPVRYSITGIDGEVSHMDMIHILNFSYDGITGVSTLANARNILSLCYSADNHALGFYASGCGVSGVLSSDKPLKPEQIEDLKKNWKKSVGSEGEPGGLVVIEGGMKFNTVSLDAQSSQLVETRTFNIDEVGRFFNISPAKLYDMTNESYSSVEASQLSFLTDTLAPLCQKFESEFSYKLFADEPTEVCFETEAMLRLDRNSLSNYYLKMFQIGAYSIDEIRKAIGLPKLKEGGNVNFTQCNVMPVANAVKNKPSSSSITNSGNEDDKAGQPENNNK